VRDHAAADGAIGADGRDGLGVLDAQRARVRHSGRKADPEGAEGAQSSTRAAREFDEIAPRQGRVERLTWGSVDPAPRDEPAAIPVLDGVRSLDFRFLGASDWQGTWGLPGSADKVPAAVEMTLVLEGGERIVRLVDLPRKP